MKLKLVENLIEHFDSSFDLEFDVNEVLEDTEDAGKGYGTVTLTIEDAGSDIWDFLNTDTLLTDDQKALFSEDDAAWENYLEANFDMLVDRYDAKFRDKYKDKALAKIYDSWDSYSDEKSFSLLENDINAYYDLVAKNLRLR